MTRSTPPIWEMSEEMLFVRLIRKVIGMDNKQLGRRWLIAVSAIIMMIAAANASGPQQDQSNIPHDVPKAATQAMQLAQKWHSDTQMIDLRVRESNGYALEFNFSSPSDRSTCAIRIIS